MRFILSPPRMEKHQFYSLFSNFWGSGADTPGLIHAKFGVLEYTHGLHLPAKFYWIRFIPSLLRMENFNVSFSTFAAVLAPPSVLQTKLNVGTHLQTFPSPTIPRPFPYVNAFMAKCRSQTMSFKKHDGKTNKNIDRFRLLSAREIRAPPNLAC